MAKIETVLEFDKSDNGLYGHYARAQVLVNVFNPLERGTMVLDELGGKTWVYFKYEKLLNFYYVCGLLNHIEGDYDKYLNASSSFAWVYGPYLRASPGHSWFMNQYVYTKLVHCVTST